MTGMWFSLTSRGRVPEMRERPREIKMHIAAETLTAALPIASAVALALGMGR